MTDNPTHDRIAVLGVGYVGLRLALALAQWSLTSTAFLANQAAT